MWCQSAVLVSKPQQSMILYFSYVSFPSEIFYGKPSIGVISLTLIKLFIVLL